MTTSTLMCFPFAVASEAPRSATQSVKGASRARAALRMSMKRRRVLHPVEEVRRVLDADLDPRAREEEPRDDGDGDEPRVLVGVLGRRVFRLRRLVHDEPEHHAREQRAEDQPRHVPAADDVFAREPLQRNPEAERRDLREQHADADGFVSDLRPDRVEPRERRPPMGAWEARSTEKESAFGGSTGMVPPREGIVRVAANRMKADQTTEMRNPLPARRRGLGVGLASEAVTARPQAASLCRRAPVRTSSRADGHASA